MANKFSNETFLYARMGFALLIPLILVLMFVLVEGGKYLANKILDSITS